MSEKVKVSRQVRRAEQRQADKENKTTQTIITNSVEDLDALANGAWDDLMGIYNECLALSMQPVNILPLLRDVDKVARVKDQKMLSQQSTVLAKDLANFKTKLTAIYNRHSSRKGGSSNPNELMICLSIGEEYQNWMTQFQLIVMPAMADVLSHFENLNNDSPVEGEVIVNE